MFKSIDQQLDSLQRRADTLQSLREQTPSVAQFALPSQPLVAELNAQVVHIRDTCRTFLVLIDALRIDYADDSTIIREAIATVRSELTLAYQLQRRIIRLAVIQHLDVDPSLAFTRRIP